jgi:hypothetical protein
VEGGDARLAGVAGGGSQVGGEELGAYVLEDEVPLATGLDGALADALVGALRCTGGGAG